MVLRAHFLGGADEIGASCLLIEAAGRRVLVDAGVRMGARQRDRLPDLALVSDLGGLDAILVTHAHLDHSGALPLIHGAYPRVPVVATAATQALLRVLLLDAIKVMASKSEAEEEIPLYPKAAVEALLARAIGVRFLEPVPLCDGELRATFYPAGHVLGAAAVGLETPEGNVLITGDVSLTDQLTVAGMPRPAFAPDLMVCESTYGARLHASRRAEEARLGEAVLAVVRQGGKVLIPAFALGRAQEVLLVLRKALAQEAPEVTVFVDGMVRAICAVYSGFPEFLAPRLRERAAAGRGLFYTGDGRVRAVETPMEREEILSGGPVVIVSSSGMLSGGPSTSYAARLAGDSGALIAITGYQDEEAPGRRLQEVERGERQELVLDGKAVKVACQVRTYGLSAHADAQELAGLTAALRPGAVALVHGDPEARRGLARTLTDCGIRSLHLPSAGSVVEVARRSKRSRPRQVGVGAGRPLDADALAELHKLFWAEGRPTGRTYSARELAEQWHGTDGVPVDLAPVRELLDGSQRFFVPDAKRPFLYRWSDPAGATDEPTETVEQDSRMEQNAALALADELLGSSAGLYRRGAERETWTLRLFFHFPDMARERYAEAMDELAERSGWAVEVHPEAHLATLTERALSLLPEGVRATRSASVYTQERTVKLTVSELPYEEEIEWLSRRLVAETGYALALELAPPGTAPAKQAFDESGRMEINLAFAEVDRAFVPLADAPYKKSKKSDSEGDSLELSFISPEVADRYQAVLEELRELTGWRIKVARKVDQQGVLAAARGLIPEAWSLLKNPGLDVANRKVLLKLASPPPPDELESLAQELELRTGFTFKVK
jgi:Cft2 family RNA processing exonuclease